jgi:hypothetical protein
MIPQSIIMGLYILIGKVGHIDTGDISRFIYLKRISFFLLLKNGKIELMVDMHLNTG